MAFRASKYLQDSQAAFYFCFFFVSSQKAIVEKLNLLHIFCHQVDMKNVVKYWKDFLWYATLKKHTILSTKRILTFH